MNKYRLDYENAQIVQMSNDAFFYILEDEEPLDEENFSEIHKLSKMFPYGFSVDSNAKFTKAGMVEAKIIPYVKDDCDYDEYCDITKYVQIQIKWTGTSKINAWLFNSQKGTRELLGNFETYVNKFKNECFKVRGCLFFLKNFKKK